MRISAKTDYALRALTQLAAHADRPVSSEELAQGQEIPHKFLEAIMAELRRTGFITSQRGTGGGHRLRLPADQVVIADVIRALNGPLTVIRGECPQDIEYGPPSEGLQIVWIAMRATLRSILESVTLADIAGGALPGHVRELAGDPDAWVTHWFQSPGRIQETGRKV
ncbi:RrF2 family transcriptional regulator [Streptosporangium amethystogenes]|uniref:RrF2 family transcriptional regulator n=1 Tax=Streptosporangium amethystogenes TaxID=2002 RepID=UPI00069084CA|nr:Rrf2 family transcriptional regulator [Streptosporangium amethystogenes]